MYEMAGDFKIKYVNYADPYDYMYLLMRYLTGTSDNDITCEMSTLIAERLVASLLGACLQRYL
jgi:hypothetical protein